MKLKINAANIVKKLLLKETSLFRKYKQQKFELSKNTYLLPKKTALTVKFRIRNYEANASGTFLKLLRKPQEY